MLTRLHISSFIGLIFIFWVLVLWIQGESILNINYAKPFSLVVGVITALVFIFNKYMWSWKIFRGWYVKRPDLRGTWRVELRSNFVKPETNKQIKPIYGYAVIRQSLTFLSVRLMTKESRSVLVAHSIEQQEDTDLFKLVGVYRNEPKIELQDAGSSIHHGAFSLDVHGSPVYELTGHYWTDRTTKGGMTLSNKVKKLYDTYEQADQELQPDNKIA